MKTKNKLLIIGASGHGKVIADMAKKMELWQQIFFLDDNVNLESFMGLDIIGKSSEAISYIKDYDVFIAIGSNKTREMLQKQLELAGASIPTLIHPSAIIGDMVEIGNGTAIMAGTVISCSCNIGKGVIINTGVTIDHDNILSDYVHLSPGSHTAGTVQIGRSTWVGTGAIISNNLRIIEECVIGAGTVVISDITISGTYVGVPARRLR
jgi:sugar O-acyltransferase (sialic acid O-acetyltransferase NeuD family)